MHGGRARVCREIDTWGEGGLGKLLILIFFKKIFLSSYLIFFSHFKTISYFLLILFF